MPALLIKNLSLCCSIIKRPKLSHVTATSDDLHRPSSATTSSSHSAPFRTYNSLYDPSATASSTTASDDGDNDDDMLTATPDIASAYASRRFFVSSPGRSNSIVDSPSETASDPAEEEAEAVEKYSPDPYADFRRSMGEMVEARGLHDVQENWRSLHALLLCYLSLNPKPTHKFIVGAFADLLVSLMSPPQDGTAAFTELKFPAGGVGVCGCSCD